MRKQLIIGLTVEGNTDVRFFRSIVERSFDEIAFECEGEVEILAVQVIEAKGKFVEAVQQAAQQAIERGVMVLCVHQTALCKHFYMYLPNQSQQQKSGSILTRFLIPETSLNSYFAAA